MKKIIALLLAAVLLVSLTACKAKEPEEKDESSSLAELVPEAEAAAKAETQANAQDETPAGETTPPAPAPEAVVVTPEEMAGSWKLSENNDMEQLETLFPEAGALGGMMEVGLDGLMFWTIGTFGGAGNFTVDGETVTAAVYSDHNGDTETALCTLDPTGETLTMEYNGVTILWSRS